MCEMNYHTAIVIFFYWRGVLGREERLFRKSYFLKGCSLERGRLSESGRSLDHLRVINEKIPLQK